MRVLPTKWRRKPAGIDMERNYVTVTLCIVYHSLLILVVLMLLNNQYLVLMFRSF